MEAEELRIGNLLQWDDESNDITKILCIKKEYEDLEYWVLCENIQCPPDNRLFDEVYLSELIGIKLTEEWLLKLGFGKMYPESGYDLNNLIINKFDRGFIFFYGRWETRIDYVHQLQNLYYALAGEELKLKQDEK